MLEEYKLFCDMAQKLSERRQTSTQTYLAVNTAIFTVLAFLVKDAGFRGWSMIEVTAPLYLAGIAVSIVWLRTIYDFRRVIGWRYDQLREMEKVMPDSYRTLTKEYEAYYHAKGGISFSNLEAWMPKLFIILYAVYGMGVLIATALGLL